MKIIYIYVYIIISHITLAWRLNVQISLKFIWYISLIPNLKFAWFDRSTCKGGILEEKEREKESVIAAT